jgi:hypothetical protein
MKTFTEFNIIQEDVSLPEVETFCPFIWESDNFDVDGDYYYDCYPLKQWAELNLTTNYKDEANSIFSLNVLRRTNLLTPSPEVMELNRFFSYIDNERYIDHPLISKIEKPVLGLIQFETHSIDHYQHFLETVAMYLKHTKGIVLNYLNCDYNKFIKKFKV